jgi:peroxiredoxin
MLFWADDNDQTEVMVHNTAGNRAVSMGFSTKQLPLFALWKNPGSSNDGYAMGFETGTVFPRNKVIESKFGEVPKLAPNQSRSFTIDFALHSSSEQFNIAAGKVSQIWAGRRTKVDAHPPSGVTVKLTDVIKAARTWGPAFTSWYGKPAPDFVLTDITGKEHKLSDYRGKDIMIILWATWCGPCRQEIPHLIELRDTIGEDKLAMFGISNENPELVKRFAAQMKLNYTIVVDRGNMPSPYRDVQGIPSSFFIDSEGKMKLATTGLISLEESKAILEAE